MATILEQFSATSGYLEHSPITFTQGLNCVIGARGTCKSTLVESIRFAFNSDPDRIDTLIGKRNDDISFYNKINATLGGGSIRCETRDTADSTTYSIERDMHSEPRIYKDSVKDYTDTLQILNHIEIYSQGDLQQIAEKEHLRLKLIDRPNFTRIEELRKEQEKVAANLRDIGPKIKIAKGRIEQLRSQLKVLPELHKQLQAERDLRPNLSRELDEYRNFFLKRKSALETFQRAMKIRESVIEDTNNLNEYFEQLNTSLELVNNLGLQEAESVMRSISETAGMIDSLSKIIDSLKQLPLVKVNANFQEKIEVLNEPYYELRKQEQEANESLKKEDELKRQIEILEKERSELTKIEEEQRKLIDERVLLRSELKRLSNEIYQLRLSQVESINEKHGDLVVLTLEQGSLGGKYLEKVEKILNGSRLRNQNEIATEIATILKPEDLVDLIEAADTKALATILSRDVIQTTRLMSFLIDSAEIYELEGHIFEDKLNITMFDDGQSKPVRNLSKGQKATALLPLILRDADYPLIFDQPEDDLDNRFIFNSLVRTILDLKTRRQIIFVTHNANIPVIGEAENVIVMKMESPTQATKPLQGSVDERQKEVIDLLEGGAAAFIERQRKYQDLLTSNE